MTTVPEVEKSFTIYTIVSSQF